MAKHKKNPAKRKHVKKRLETPTRYYTYSLPVFFKLQFTFREDEIEDPEDDDPDIVESALHEMENEIKDYLAENYVVDSVEVFDDALDSVFLGVSTFIQEKNGKLRVISPK